MTTLNAIELSSQLGIREHLHSEKMDLLLLILVLLPLSLDQTVCAFPTEDFNNSSENFVPCEDGWYYFNEKCYKIEGYETPDARLSWDDAVARCSELDANLVSIHSKNENDFISAFIALNIKQAVLIGLNDRDRESNFVWQDGSPLDYKNWEPGQPTNYLNREDCVEFHSEPFPEKAGQWNDESCDLKLAYICQKNSNNSLRASDLRLCSPEEGRGWKFRDSCYSMVKEKKSWHDAEKYCQNILNGHLVKIMDIAHDTFLNFVLSQSKDHLWIGIKVQLTTHKKGGLNSFVGSAGELGSINFEGNCSVTQTTVCRDICLNALENFEPKWSSGWHVVYDHFDEPIEDLESDLCILRWNKNIWTSTSCAEEHPFICEKSEVNHPVLPTPTQESRCPQLNRGWKDLGGEFCYYFETKTSLSWYDAENECVKRGGILASIHSKEEEDMLHYFVKPFSDIYIGLNSLLTNGEYFIWSDGTHMVYRHWSKNEPSTKSEMCVQLLTADMSWNDISCATQKGFICQAEKVPIDKNEKEESEEDVKSETSSSFTIEKSEITASTVFISGSPVAVSGTEAVKKEIENIPGSVSYAALYGLCVAVLFLGIMFGILIYISRKGLKWKANFLPTVLFRKSGSYKKFQNVWSADIVFNNEDESCHM